MKRIALLLLTSFLVGCPAENRLYIHNESDDTLTSRQPNANWDDVVIRPGSTKYISFALQKESCFSLFVGEEERSFHLPMAMLVQRKATRYGVRLDIYYEYGLLNFQNDDGQWTQLEEISECEDT